MLVKKPMSSLFAAMGGRSGAKLAYRMLADLGMREDEIRSSILAATIEAIGEEDTILLVQDTTDIDYNGHKAMEGLGYSSEHVKGIKLHTCQALTPDGIPIGIMHQSTITREFAKDETLTPYEKAKRPIEEKESFRWIETLRKTVAAIPEGVKAITVCDRECDMYEFFSEATRLGASFVVRLVNNRVDEESGEKIKDLLEGAAPIGEIGIEIPRDSLKKRAARAVDLKVTSAAVTLKKPDIRKEDTLLDTVTLNIVHLVEQNPPTEVEPVEWFLMTDLPVSTITECQRILKYYVQRWKIERFHFVLKSGCAVEKIQQHDIKRVIPLLYIYSVIASYIMALTLCGRETPDLPCDVFFDEDEWKTLYCAANRTTDVPEEAYTINQALAYLRILGTGKTAPSDGKPGAKAIWQGLFALYILSEFGKFVYKV